MTEPRDADELLIAICEMLKRHQSAIYALDADVQALLLLVPAQNGRSFEQLKQKLLRDGAPSHDQQMRSLDALIERLRRT
jgi:hypothetical protein